MQKLLKEISKRAILLNDITFSKEQIDTEWLGNPSATEEDIEIAEQRLNVKLPSDYIDFLKICNGFQASTFVFSTFLPVNEIGYLKDLDEDTVETWCEIDEFDDNNLNEMKTNLARSILIGGLNEEQYALLIPPKRIGDKWGYWIFASWIPGEEVLDNFVDYFNGQLNVLQSEIDGLEEPKFIIDFSLREAVFALDWANVFDISARFVLEKKSYGYYNGNPDLYALMLISAHKTNRQNDFLQFIQKVKEVIDDQQIRNDYLLQKYEDAVKENVAFLVDMQELHRFKPRVNPKGLEAIELQIEEHRKDLLKPKNSVEKIDYQLFFLFDFGNAHAFIDLYELHSAYLFYTNYLKAAMIYVYLNEFEKARIALEKYKKIALEFRPFEPYLNETLLPILENKNL